LLGCGELQVLPQLAELGLDALEQRDLGLGRRTLPKDRLGGRCVVPEALAKRALGELFQGAFQLGDVKDVPAGPGNDAAGPAGYRGSR
jgi:hypothetical protein